VQEKIRPVGGSTSEEGAVLYGMGEWGKGVFDIVFVGVGIEVGIAEEY
jgi:hypothetical protein